MICGMRSWAVQAIFAGVMGASTYALAQADEVTPLSSGRVHSLVDQLADADFSTRQLASQKLLRIGARALPKLSTAAQSSDPEARVRAQRLILQIRRETHETNLKSFVQGSVRGSFQTPAGWAAFSAEIGDSYPAREMYADICRAEPQLIGTAFGTTSRPVAQKRLNELILQRAQRLGRSGKSKRLSGSQMSSKRRRTASMQALLFIAAQHPHQLSDRAEQLVTQVGRAEGSRLESLTPEKTALSRRLLSLWVNRCASTDLYIVSQLLRLASSAELSEAIPMAVAVANGSRRLEPNHNELRAVALLLVGKLGSEKDIQRIAPLLEDRAICITQRREANQDQPADVQIRDVALAVTLHLSGEDLREHGFTEAKAHNQKLYQLRSLAFKSTKVREASLASWNERNLAGIASEIRVAGSQTDAVQR